MKVTDPVQYLHWPIFTELNIPVRLLGFSQIRNLNLRMRHSPLYFLIQTGQEQNYKKEIANTLSNEFQSKTSETAAYALAAMDAKEFAADHRFVLKQ